MIRHQQRRGEKLPDGVKSVARPSRWGNPYKVGSQFVGTTAETKTPEGFDGCAVNTILDERLAVELFRHHARSQLEGWLDPLRVATGLACYCDLDDPCHADVLIELLLEEGATNAG